VHACEWNPGAASVASFVAAVVAAEIYLCDVCPCQEMLRRNGRGLDSVEALQRGLKANHVTARCTIHEVRSIVTPAPIIIG
jgi:hypothetical protein